MRTIILSCLLLSGLSGAALFACGGDSATINDATPDASTGKDSGGNNGNDSGGGGNDSGGGNQDSGNNNTTPDGSNPNVISCGDSLSCDKPQLCCIAANGTPSCGASCTGGASLACDEKADCTTGVCCAAIDFQARSANTSCKASCGDGGIQACKTDGECPNGTCKVWDCYGYKIQSCANPLPFIPNACK